MYFHPSYAILRLIYHVGKNIGYRRTIYRGAVFAIASLTLDMKSPLSNHQIVPLSGIVTTQSRQYRSFLNYLFEKGKQPLGNSRRKIPVQRVITASESDMESLELSRDNQQHLKMHCYPGNLGRCHLCEPVDIEILNFSHPSQSSTARPSPAHTTSPGNAYQTHPPHPETSSQIPDRLAVYG